MSSSSDLSSSSTDLDILPKHRQARNALDVAFVSSDDDQDNTYISPRRSPLSSKRKLFGSKQTQKKHGLDDFIVNSSSEDEESVDVHVIRKPHRRGPGFDELVRATPTKTTLGEQYRKRSKPVQLDFDSDSDPDHDDLSDIPFPKASPRRQSSTIRPNPSLLASSQTSRHPSTPQHPPKGVISLLQMQNNPNKKRQRPADEDEQDPPPSHSHPAPPTRKPPPVVRKGIMERRVLGSKNGTLYFGQPYREEQRKELLTRNHPPQQQERSPSVVLAMGHDASKRDHHLTPSGDDSDTSDDSHSRTDTSDTSDSSDDDDDSSDSSVSDNGKSRSRKELGDSHRSSSDSDNDNDNDNDSSSSSDTNSYTTIKLQSKSHHTHSNKKDTANSNPTTSTMDMNMNMNISLDLGSESDSNDEARKEGSKSKWEQNQKNRRAAFTLRQKKKDRSQASAYSQFGYDLNQTKLYHCKAIGIRNAVLATPEPSPFTVQDLMVGHNSHQIETADLTTSETPPPVITIDDDDDDDDDDVSKVLNP